MKMSKIVPGKNAKNGKLTLLQTLESCFGQFGIYRYAENFVYATSTFYFYRKKINYYIYKYTNLINSQSF
jgi:hypothetical protein